MVFTFSIVTVVRNEENNILKTLQSVRAQNAGDDPSFSVEHIIIDGVSTDDTVAIIKDFIKDASTSSNVSYKFVSESDNGIYDAMNKGRAMASGDFVFFLNAGDLFSNNTVLKRVHEFIISRADLNLIFYGAVNINSELTSWKRPIITPVSEPHMIADFRDEPHHQSIFYPKIFYCSNEYDTSFIKYGDTDFTLRACAQIYAIYLSFEITNVTLGGFSTKRHSFREAYEIYLDFKKLSDKHPSSFTSLEKFSKPFYFIVKFVLDAFGANNLKHWAMKQFFQLRRTS